MSLDSADYLPATVDQGDQHKTESHAASPLHALLSSPDPVTRGRAARALQNRRTPTQLAANDLGSACRQAYGPHWSANTGTLGDPPHYCVYQQLDNNGYDNNITQSINHPIDTGAYLGRKLWGLVR
jgi:hypothetical protein